ncbi:unnamed protein product, partial [marine sediment metagenome]
METFTQIDTLTKKARDQEDAFASSLGHSIAILYLNEQSAVFQEQLTTLVMQHACNLVNQLQEVLKTGNQTQRISACEAFFEHEKKAEANALGT